MNPSQNDVDSATAADATRAWKLIHDHDNPFDNDATDQEIEPILEAIAARTEAPYIEALRRLVGVEASNESEARSFFQAILEHRHTMARALDRRVHIRVAALDWLTSQQTPSERASHHHPILVAPSLLERAFEVATADELTGLPQRAHFMNLLRHELRQRRRRNVCVAFIDLDGFKRVNDVYGHARGDDVLRMLARLSRGALREGDVLARIGGDEFAVLLLDVSPGEAEAALKRLRDRFERLTATLGTSFSAGLAIARIGESAEHVVMRADDAMYRQKRLRTEELSSESTKQVESRRLSRT